MSVTKKKQHATTCFTWVGTKERKVKKKKILFTSLEGWLIHAKQK